ncbi:MAG: rod shape-determining protein MreC, partial [Candidatus Pacebacteria bacterium]|nr:rod shape-determining protein MreC [Candidatus Paceibacterota bacterium]
MVKDFIFQSQTQNKGRKNRPWFILLFFLIVVTFLLKFSPPSILTRSFVFVSRPILLLKNQTLQSASDFLSIFYFKSYLVDQNKALSDKLSSLEGVQAKLKLEEDENASLKQSLSVLPERAADTFLAVILKPPSFPYDTLLADGGMNQNLEVGNLVYAGEHVLVGQVEEVYGKTSKIKFLSSPGEVTEAFIGPHALPAELQGVGGGNFEAKIPRGADVVLGDSVYIQNINRDLIGTVGTLDPVSSDSYVGGIVVSPV